MPERNWETGTLITQPSGNCVAPDANLTETEAAKLARDLLESDPDRGSVLLTQDRQVVYSNATARNLLRDGSARGKDGLLPSVVDDWLVGFIDRARSQRGPASADLYYPSEKDRRMQISFETAPTSRWRSTNGKASAKGESPFFVVMRVQTARSWNEPTVRRLQSRFGLTLREAEVAAGVSRGLTNAEVAGRLGIVEKTVKNVLMSVYSKCEVRNRVELALRAYDAPVGTLDRKI